MVPSKQRKKRQQQPARENCELVLNGLVINGSHPIEIEQERLKTSVQAQ